MRYKKQTIRSWKCIERDLDRLEEFRRVQSVHVIDADYVIKYREWPLAQESLKRPGETVAPRTVNKEVGTLRNMLNAGVKRFKVIQSNPITGIEELRAASMDSADAYGR